MQHLLVLSVVLTGPVSNSFTCFTLPLQVCPV